MQWRCGHSTLHTGPAQWHGWLHLATWAPAPGDSLNTVYCKYCLSTVNTKCKVLVSDLSQSDGNNTIYGVRGCCQGRLLPASHICRVEHTLTIMFEVSNANLGLEIESTPMKWCPGRTRSMHEADIAVVSAVASILCLYSRLARPIIGLMVV